MMVYCLLTNMNWYKNLILKDLKASVNKKIEMKYLFNTNSIITK